MTPTATLLLAAVIVGGSALALSIADPVTGDPRIASTDVAEVCATDGLPGSAYSRKHRVVPRKPVPGHQIDHIVPLCLGGADVDANIQIQPIEEALEKDKLERAACIAVCRRHSVGLGEAQDWFLSGWRAEMWRIKQ